MAIENSNWDDIPSIEGLEIDWDYEPENPLGKRADSRLTIKELSLLLEEKCGIQVRLVTELGQFLAELIDVSQGGIRLKTNPVKFKKSQLAKIGFRLGNRPLIARGRIKHIHEEKEYVLLGIEFVGLPDSDGKFIAGLYAYSKL